MSIVRPFIAELPCASCRTRDCETVAGCDAYSRACELSGYAVEAATLIRKLRRITDEDRAELAQRTADNIADALDNVGARLDDSAFMHACGAVAWKAVTS